MEIRINGKPREIDLASTVADLLRASNLDPQGVVVECNGRIIPIEDYGETRLQADDCLEILRFVGGG